MQIGLNDISNFYFLFPCSELSIEIMLLPLAMEWYIWQLNGLFYVVAYCVQVLLGRSYLRVDKSLLRHRVRLSHFKKMAI